MRAVKSRGTDDGVQVKVPSVDQVDAGLGHLVNLTGDDGDVRL